MADISWFDASSFEDYGLVPPGDYSAVIVQSEMRPNRAGTGEYLLLVFEIVEGEHAGRRVATRLNLKHPNPKAVEIAGSKLAAILRAVGVARPHDTSELHDIPLSIRVTTETGMDGQASFNEVTSFKKLGKLSPSQAGGQADAPKQLSAPW